MLSRVAESVYWMSRQIERAENHARFLEVTLHLILDQPENLVDPWDPLVRITGDEEWFKEKYGVANQENVVNFLAFDDEYPHSMLTCLRAARENARGVREKLSSEAFEQINEFYHFVNEASKNELLDRDSQFFDEVREHTIQWSGILTSTMAQDTAWHFANVGRMLERADKTSRILDVKYFNLFYSLEHVGTAIDDLQWSSLLLAISGFEAYRRDYHTIDLDNVVGFFLFNKTFPRSVHHCVASAGWSLGQIDEASVQGVPRNSSKVLEALQQRLANTEVKEVLAIGMHEFVDGLQEELNAIGSSMSEDYFQISVGV
ncbi:Uncharacterized conserved protein, Alpha-E superfamily [Neorhodopirellula lusitana]|uniref:Uncharacterized conserved protein, Alpha-E superfamily n=1 Tax=Neorhodopirellula lusitana TaxID=445327 RepID=A0ABY1Q703_9BACT|nr:alpha-E domain-containing protein [Neorhodopirellula lusitana]SMP58454.1 Uncharacterized conserved protein, Alpha-E superfamily [Neorhodopirellula lusitana]